MLNAKTDLPKKQPTNGAPVNPNDSGREGLAGSFNYVCVDDEIVIDCSKLWHWMKPSYRKAALIITGMDAALKCGQPISFPNANLFMNSSWDLIPLEWQQKLKRYFVQ